MKSENLVLIAQGLQTIAGALISESGINGTAVEAVNEITTVVSKIVPKSEANSSQEPPTVEEADDEEGYTLAELEAMKVTELKEIADDNEIEYPSKVKKSDLIDLIMGEADDEDEEDDSDDEVEAEEAEDEAEEEEEDEEEDDSDDEEGEELTEEDLEEMSLAELKELADEYEVSYPKVVKAPKLRQILIDELFQEEEEEEVEEDEDVDSSDISPEDLDEMSLTELKELADSYEVIIPKAVKVGKLRQILLENLFDEDELEQDTDDDDDSDETALDEIDYATELGLNDMDVEELAEILSDSGLSTKGKKQALITRIVKGIEDGDIEIEDEEEEGK